SRARSRVIRSGRPSRRQSWPASWKWQAKSGDANGDQEGRAKTRHLSPYLPGGVLRADEGDRGGEAGAGGEHQALAEYPGAVGPRPAREDDAQVAGLSAGADAIAAGDRVPGGREGEPGARAPGERRDARDRAAASAALSV